jgi:TetR/AcrR family transcriptional repressor of nem operon
MRYPAEQTAAKYGRIVKEASRLFRERGFENVTVADVVKAAGLTHGAFYGRFASKEELHSAAVAYGQDLSAKRVHSTATRSSKRDRMVAPRQSGRWVHHSRSGKRACRQR